MASAHTPPSSKSEYNGRSLDLNFPWMTNPTSPPATPPSLSAYYDIKPCTLGFNSSGSSTDSDRQYPLNMTYTMGSPQSVTGYYNLHLSSSDLSSNASSSGESCSSRAYSNNSPSSSETSSLDRTTPSPPVKKTKSSSKGTKSGRATTSYLEMIAKALLSNPKHRMVLADIYAYISEHYPHYRSTDSSWKNAVRHNLCVNAGFVKAEHSNSGRGHFWTIHPACVGIFSRGIYRRMTARRMVQRMCNGGKPAIDSGSNLEQSLSHTSSPSRSSLSPPSVHYPAVATTFTVSPSSQEYLSGIVANGHRASVSSPANVYYMTSTPIESRPPVAYNHFYTDHQMGQTHMNITPSSIYGAMSRLSTPSSHVPMSRLPTQGSHVPMSRPSTPGSHVPMSRLPTQGSHVPMSRLSTPSSHVPMSRLPTQGSHVPMSHLSTPNSHVPMSRLSTPNSHVPMSRLSTPGSHCSMSFLSVPSPASLYYTPPMVNYPSHFNSQFYNHMSPVMSTAAYRRPEDAVIKVE